MKTHLATVAVLLSLASPLSAQEKTPIRDASILFYGSVEWKPIIFMAAGQAADGLSTVHNFSRGCGEANEVAYGQNPSVRRVLLTKGATIATTAAFMVMWQKMGHPKVAKWFGVFGGALGFGAAGYNLTVNCGGAR